MKGTANLTLPFKKPIRFKGKRHLEPSNISVWRYTPRCLWLECKNNKTHSLWQIFTEFFTEKLFTVKQATGRTICILKMIYDDYAYSMNLLPPYNSLPRMKDGFLLTSDNSSYGWHFAFFFMLSSFAFPPSLLFFFNGTFLLWPSGRQPLSEDIHIYRKLFAYANVGLFACLSDRNVMIKNLQLAYSPFAPCVLRISKKTLQLKSGLPRHIPGECERLFCSIAADFKR